MFVLRCLGVSLSCFLLFYMIGSAVVALGWRRLRSVLHHISPQRLASILFLSRSLPVVVAVVATAAFVVPSFLLLEPRVVTEPVGELPLTLAALCVFLFGAGLINAISAQVKTSQTVTRCIQGAIAGSDCHPLPLYRIRPSSPALAVAGIRCPKVLLSEAAAALLSPLELAAALRHEVAHVHRHDNLKKLLFRVCIFPGMKNLEAAWSEVAEIAADDAAVSSSREALDLASALIKLSRFAPVHTPALMTGLIQERNSGLNARISRLVTWEETPRPQRRELLPWFLAPALVTGILCMVMTYSGVLTRMHEMTEWLIR